jgi:hypothetical protein
VPKSKAPGERHVIHHLRSTWRTSQALGHKNTSLEDLEEIKKIISKLEEKKK